MNTVAKNIKRLRTQNNMTQEDLAERMNVTRQTVSNWENEKNQPDIETLKALSAVFETDLYGTAVYPLKPLVTQFLPACSGIAASIHRNRKR